MRILAARFSDPEDAHHALAELRAAEVDAARAAVRPMGSTDYAAHADATVLAGRFPVGRADDVAEIMARYGGELLVDEDEDDLFR